MDIQEVENSIHVPLPEDTSTGIGCVGSGFIMADCHLVAYRQHGLNPVGITSKTRANAQAVADRHEIGSVYDTVTELVANPEVQILDVAVPPDLQLPVIKEALAAPNSLKGILAQKPLGCDYAEALEVVQLCERSGVTLGVNQNMRYDHSVRACDHLLKSGTLGEPVLATIDMRAIPHWMPWQERQGWVTTRIMSIHHLDTFRYWLGNPDRIFASVRPDPRTTFAHQDGIGLYTLEYNSGPRASSWDDVWAGPAREGAAAEIGIQWRVEGTEGLAKGTIGWPSYPERTPSTLDYSTIHDGAQWKSPRWDKVWFPDAFIGPMADLLTAVQTGSQHPCNGQDNLWTMALVDAAYTSASQHRAVAPAEIVERAGAG